MPDVLPIPALGTPYLAPSGGISEIWRRYFQSLDQALALNVAPSNAAFWVSQANTELSNEQNLGLLATGYLRITTVAQIATPSTTTTIPVADLSGAGTLTRVNDTNVTLTLGGTPTGALIKAVSLSLGWQGELGLARGGTAADLSGTGGTSRVLRQSSLGAAVTVSQLGIGDISGMGTTATAYGTGTAYVLTNTAAALNFGTTDPAVTLTAAGTYLLMGQVHLAYNAATVVAETATVKIRRTNNTAADLSPVVVIDLPVATTLTYSYGVVPIPPVIYTTAATDDAVTIFGNVSATLGAGSIDATAIGTSIVALRVAA